MTVSIAASGDAARAIEQVVPRLVADLVASGITAQDADLWGTTAEAEASKRLGWVEAVSVSRPLVAEVTALRESLRAEGVDHVVLAGMGGSSLAPEVITRTAGVPLTVLDSTDPAQVRAAVTTDLERTVLVVSSKSGSTLETDSQRRVYEQAFRDAGIDPARRIVVVTDPGSALEAAAIDAGYRVFTADPTVGGRYSALTAFGLVPSGLAGADIAELLDEADAISALLSVDLDENPGLVLGAVLAGTEPLRDKIAIVPDGTHIVGFGDWVEQLIAESTGKDGRGLLPVVLHADSPEVTAGLPDVQVIRLVGSREDERHVAEGEVEITGTLGGQILVWEYAVAVAGRLLGINPFDQPDVEAAKVATRALLDDRPVAAQPPSPRTASPSTRRPDSRSVRRSRKPCRASCPHSTRPATCRCRRTSTAPRTAASSRCATRSRRARSAPSPSGTAPGSCTRPASTTRAAPPRECSCRSWPTQRTTWRSRVGRSRSGSSSRPRQPATRVSSPSTAGRSSPSRRRTSTPPPRRSRPPSPTDS